MYQSRRVPFSNKENYNEKRTFRAEEKVKNRRLSRQRDFTSNRNIAVDLVLSVPEEPKVPVKSSRHEQLLQWKREKERLVKAEKEKKAKEKPPFKCGVVHYEPPPTLNTGCRRSSRVKIMKNPAKIVKVPVAKSKVTERKKNNQLPSGGEMFHSFFPASHRFKAPNNLPKIGEESISQTSNTNEWHSTFSLSFPDNLSPWISKVGASDDGKKLSPSCKQKNESPLTSKKTQSPKKGICVTPRRSSRRVTFADTTPENAAIAPKLSHQLTPHIRNSRDQQHTTRRKSPRFSKSK